MATAAMKEEEKAVTEERDLEVKKGRKLQVSALKSGTVIDHLTQGTAPRTLQLLDLDRGATVLLGVNLPSGKQGFKDLIKIEGRELTQEEINKVALLSPKATLSIIRDYEVVRKIQPNAPDSVEGLIRCVNPSCVSQDPLVRTHFYTERKDPLKLRCFYCERSFDKDEIDFI